ncbi:hypothetical protein Tco_0665014 [Tanacetum coccineum]
MSQHILSLFKTKTRHFKRYKSFFDELQGRYSYLFGHLKTRFLARTKFNVLAQHLQEVMEEALPKMVDDHVKELTKIQVPIYVAEVLIKERQKNRTDVAKMIADAIQQERDNLWAKITSQINNAITNHIPSHDDPHDDAHHERENRAKRQKTSEHRTYVIRESSSGQVNKSEPGPSTSGNQEQLDDFKFWTNTHASNDDELPTKKVSQELVEEMSQTIDEAKLRKVVNEMLTQRCTSRDEHYYFSDNDIEERASRWADQCNVDDYIETGLMWSLSVFIRSTVIWERLHDFQLGVESYQQKVNLTAPTITFPVIKKQKMFSILSEPVYGIIYKNNKKEKRVMRN